MSSKILLAAVLLAVTALGYQFAAPLDGQAAAMAIMLVCGAGFGIPAGILMAGGRRHSEPQPKQPPGVVMESRGQLWRMSPLNGAARRQLQMKVGRDEEKN